MRCLNFLITAEIVVLGGELDVCLGEVGIVRIVQGLIIKNPLCDESRSQKSRLSNPLVVVHYCYFANP